MMNGGHAAASGWTAAVLLFSAHLLTAAPDHPPTALDTAERLWRQAQTGTLSDDDCDQAAALLDDANPFAGALAEWAVAIRVGLDNGGQTARWPRPEPPPWFRRWQELDADALLRFDYCRQGIVWGLHRSPESLAGSSAKVLARVRAAAGSDASANARLEALETLQQRLLEVAAGGPSATAEAGRLWLAMRLEARPLVLAHAGLDQAELLFALRHAAHTHRNITGSQYPWVHKPGGGLVVKSGPHLDAPLRQVLADQLGPGHVHGFDLWYEGDRIVLAYARQPTWPPAVDTVRGSHAFELRRTQEPTHLFEIGVDGTGLRQLTNHPVWSDLEPTYCPNGDIVFASDRSGRSSECGRFAADHTVINIYRLSADGTRLRRLSDNKDIDRHPHCLDNGLIAYTRWEYQERHFFEVHALWTVRPDGTMADAIANQHMRAPYGLRDARSIPGTRDLVAIATGHHTFAYGPVVTVAPRYGINTAAALTTLTPHVTPQEGPMAGTRVPSGGVPDKGGLYQTPYPLSASCFLVSYSYARPPSTTGGGRNATDFGLYLIDRFGNKELLHRDLIYSVTSPMLLKPRPRPPIMPDTEAGSERHATCVVADVYTDLPGVPRGAARYLRIAQRVGWPLDAESGAKRWIPGNAWQKHFGYWAWAPVRVIGTVPVAPDGSAHFRVPVDTAVYFQLLDENHMELRRMRSHISFQAGEKRGCIGCHETQLRTPAAALSHPTAVTRPAAVPVPPPWGSQRLLGYERLVQPIFDAHCVRCHGGDTPKGNLDLTDTATESGFLQSFCSLFGRRPQGPGPVLVSVSNRFSGAGVTQPKQVGSHRSRLIEVLRTDPAHRRHAHLAPDEWVTLVTWIDANAPYHDTFYHKRPAGGGKPVRTVTANLPTPLAP